MNLKILLPFQVFADVPDVLRIVADGSAGSFGLLPHRLDCVASLVPGILVYETAAGGEKLIAVDAGVLVKTGAEVRVSVRHAIAGSDLGQLRAAVAKEFLAIDDAERKVSSVMAKLETGLISRMASFQNE